MPKPSFAQTLVLSLDLSAPAPIYRQIYGGIRDAILSGRLRAGTRLPATRTLAADLGVSRSTVLNAFEQLLAEGYLCGKIGSGTYVAQQLPDDLLQAQKSFVPGPGLSPARPRLSRIGSTVAAASIDAWCDAGAPRAFWPALPALDGFPFRIWGQLAARWYRRPPKELLAYSDPAGYRPLREALADYLGTVRAVRCTADQVFILSGSQQAMELTARLLLDPGDEAWIEDPCYPPARGALLSAGARPVGVPVDREGLIVSAGVARRAGARLALVTPSHQYPLGYTMSLARRSELLAWANRTNAWVLENDYNSFFRYRGQPLTALQGLDTNGRVIHVGTFSNVIFPALRLGYLIVPSNLVDVFRAARVVVDRHSASLEQAILADFIADGHFFRHVRRMRALYAERQALLVEAVRQRLAGRVTVSPEEAGMHLIGWLPDNTDEIKAARLAAAHKVIVQPLSAYCVAARFASGVLLGYTALNAPEIIAGARRLAVAWSAPLPSRNQESLDHF
jgi:GntR family transcriptional regulator/MocR family aminotransferase